MELQRWWSNKLEDNHLAFQNLPEIETHFLELTSEISPLEWVKSQLDVEFWFFSKLQGNAKLYQDQKEKVKIFQIAKISTRLTFSYIFPLNLQKGSN